MIEEPKTIGDCWRIYDVAGLISPELPLDKSLFPNAHILAVKLNRKAELEAELQRYKKAVEILAKHSLEATSPPDTHSVEWCANHECVSCLTDWALSEVSK